LRKKKKLRIGGEFPGSIHEGLLVITAVQSVLPEAVLEHWK
jgi:hypothetical protein